MMLTMPASSRGSCQVEASTPEISVQCSQHHAMCRMGTKSWSVDFSFELGSVLSLVKGNFHMVPQGTGGGGADFTWKWWTSSADPIFIGCPGKVGGQGLGSGR